MSAFPACPVLFNSTVARSQILLKGDGIYTVGQQLTPELRANVLVNSFSKVGSYLMEQAVAMVTGVSMTAVSPLAGM